MDTQKGAHGCATTTPVLQTPQLPGTATARPEVTRLLPTMYLRLSDPTSLCFLLSLSLTHTHTHTLSLSLSPPFLRSLLSYLCLSFSLCFSPLLSSIIRSIVPSLFNRVASVVSRFSRLAVFLVLPFSLPWPPQFAHPLPPHPVIYMRARGTSA